MSPESDAPSQVSHGLRRRLSRRSSATRSDQKKKKKKKTYGFTSDDEEEEEEVEFLEQNPLIFYQVPTKAHTPASPVLFWMQHGCPHDVVPKILAFCGPKQTATLYQCSSFWRDLIAEENTWRILCEELYKVHAVFCFVSLSIPSCSHLFLTVGDTVEGRR